MTARARESKTTATTDSSQDGNPFKSPLASRFYTSPKNQNVKPRLNLNLFVSEEDASPATPKRNGASTFGFPPTPTSAPRGAPLRISVETVGSSYFGSCAPTLTPTRPSRKALSGKTKSQGESISSKGYPPSSPSFDFRGTAPSTPKNTKQPAVDPTAVYASPPPELPHRTTKPRTVSTKAAPVPLPALPVTPPATPKNTSKSHMSKTDTSTSSKTKFSSTDWRVNDGTGVKFKLPEGFVLEEHQLFSRTWMAEKEASKFHGGYLADDMGFGKTIQVLLRILDSVAAEGHTGPTLIMCPHGVMDNYDLDLHKLNPTNSAGVKIYRFHGKNRNRNAKFLMSQSIVITTYETLASEFRALSTKTPQGYVLRADAKTTSSPFAVDWVRIILDESHLIRSPSTQRYAACIALKSKSRWCLSGTPIHNMIGDLVSQNSFLRFTEYAPSVPDPKAKNLAPRDVTDIRAFLKQVMLRRSKLDKHQWIDLADPLHHFVQCKLTNNEQRIYNLYDSGAVFSIDGNVVNRKVEMPMVRYLRKQQICILPELIYLNDGNDDEDEQFDAEEVKVDMKGPGSDDLDDLVGKAPKPRSSSKDVIDIPAVPVSTKMTKMLEILDDIELRSDGKDKTIIFSQFTSVLDKIEVFLKTNGINSVKYDGRMNVAQKSLAREKIYLDPEATVMLVSLKAGGTGLNLTACNNVILLDIWWNPAIEEQAVNRVHRIGQTKTVHIYKLTIPGTVEDKIIEKQKEKLRLANELLAPEEKLRRELFSGMWG